MRRIYAALGLLSASTLLLEITLTRLFSVAQGYHFAFLAVSLALLGFGASGSLLSAFPALLGRDLRQVLFALALLFAWAVPLSYLSSNHIPFDAYQIAWDPRQVLYMAVYYLSLGVPFTLVGLALGAALAGRPRYEAAIYAANLIGSGLGSLGALVALSLLGGERTLLLGATSGGLAALCVLPRHRRSVLAALGTLAGLGLLLADPPPIFSVSISPYKALAQVLRYPDAQLIYRAWNAQSRVDVVRSTSIRSAPGLSYGFAGDLPPQLGITVDGDDLRPLNLVQPKGDLRFLDYLPTAMPYRLVERPRVLVLEPGGGLDVLTALRFSAREVIAVESNPLLAQLVGQRFDREAGGIYHRPRVLVVEEMGRSYLHRHPELFDIVQVSLYDSFRPVTSGAYSLAENYFYTVEAFSEYLRQLTAEGFLVVQRWLQTPPSEDLRTLALAIEALEGLGIEQPAAHIAALRSFSTALILVKRTPLSAEELAELKEFATQGRFDLIYYPGMNEREADRYFVSPQPIYYRSYRQLLESSDREAFYRSYPYDVSPPRDDKPFFFHFFTLSQLPRVLADYGRTFQPFGGSGFLVMWAVLLLVLLASLLAILAPLARLGGIRTLTGERRLALYFAAIGLAFLLVEIPLIQRFILFLGYPVYALGAVLFSLLVFSGLGSAISERFPLLPAILILGLAVLTYPKALSLLFDLALGYPLGLRLALSVLALAPLATLMGVPFPRGIALARRRAALVIPWLWGINGFASVLSAVLAAILALSLGFSWVLGLGGAAYLASAALIAPLARQR